MLRKAGFVNHVTDHAVFGPKVKQQHLLCLLQQGQTFGDSSALLVPRRPQPVSSCRR